MKVKLLDKVSVDTTGDAYRAKGAQMLIEITATNYGSGTVTLEGSMNNGELSPQKWTTLTYGGNPAVFSADAIIKLDYGSTNLEVRARLSGSSGASNVLVIMAS